MAAPAHSVASPAAAAAAAAALSCSDSHHLKPSPAPVSSLPPSSFLGCRFSASPPLRHVQGHQGHSSTSWISHVSEVAVDGSSNAAAVTTSKLDGKTKDDSPEKPPSRANEATISALMADVANLVKLVDSRDIVELELKNLDYELVIRKKEALPPLPASPSYPPPQIFGQAQYPAYLPSPPPSTAASTPAPSAAPNPAPAPASAPATPSVSVPRMLSPMAGTFYRNPAPGEPPFVKVGDKVQKGQVICIVEAMKLMNEIEADQTGTVVEICAEDGKPVSVDTPLFAIKP